MTRQYRQDYTDLYDCPQDYDGWELLLSHVAHYISELFNNVFIRSSSKYLNHSKPALSHAFLHKILQPF